jgi:hypothetical protein
MLLYRVQGNTAVESVLFNFIPSESQGDRNLLRVVEQWSIRMPEERVHEHRVLQQAKCDD